MMRATSFLLLAVSAAALRLDRSTGQSSAAVMSDLKANVNLVQQTIAKAVDEFSKEQQDKLGHLKNYSFLQFQQQYNRVYGSEDGPEFIKRQKIFKNNLQYLIQHNSGPAKTFILGINKFMDFTEAEFQKQLGYKQIKSEFGAASFLQGAPKPQWNDFIKAVKLPVGHDWRPKLTYSQHWFQDQGACGSCWATAAISCLQSHLEIKHGISDMLSTQAVVSCTPNERHCGGTGGCQGATAELALQYIMENGVPSEKNWPYKSFAGTDGTCTPRLAKQTHAKIEQFITLPENKGEPLLQALYQEGPVAVSVDASTWSFYSQGVFSGCEKNAIINHAVVAEGFGANKHGQKFYLIKNSWGNDWGEKGYIRLQRFDADDAHCGIDNKPQDGTACEGGPAFVKVCGMCGVLYDSTYPRGATFISKAQGGTFDEVAVRSQISQMR